MRILKLGTPDRTKKYVVPGSPGRGVLLASLLAGTAIALVVLGLNFAGLKRLASPGPLASAHAPVDARCDDCHARNVVADLRCERCHDPSASEAWRVSGHTRFGAAVSPFRAVSAGTPRAPKEHEVRCAECHSDHRGRGFSLVRVDERHCAVCHKADTPSLEKHVEFAVVREKKTQARGMKISHERHVKEALARFLGKKRADELTAEETKRGLSGAALQRTCETCHVSTADLRGFEPIDFDRHCASCHVKDGSLGATDPMPAADVVTPDQIAAPWAPAAALVLTTRRDKVFKTAVEHADPWVLFNLAKIRREVDPAGYLADRTELVRRVQEAARSGASFPLARAGDERLAAREKELDAEIEDLGKRVSARAGVPSPAALAAEVKSFGVVAAALPTDGGKAAAEALAAALARAGGSEAAAPLAPADASARAAELLSVLDVLRRRAAASGDVLLGRRVDALARRVESLVPSRSGTADLAARLRLLVNERARLADERAYLRLQRPEGGGILAVSRLADRRGAQERALDARARLTALAAVDGLPASPLDDAQRASRVESAKSLTLPCEKCHEVGVASLARLSIDLPVMPLAVFDHRPHVRIRDCASCHAESGRGVLASKSARDVLVPGVASCRTCHNASGARAGCEACHRFHPSGYPAREGPRQPSTALRAGMRASADLPDAAGPAAGGVGP